MRGLIQAGADRFRLNFSHGDENRMQPMIDTARAAAAAEGRHITLLADIQEPKLRIGRLPSRGVLLVVPPGWQDAFLAARYGRDP